MSREKMELNEQWLKEFKMFDKYEIKVGDEVLSVNYGLKAVVTRINPMTMKAYLLYADGSTCEVVLTDNGKYKKTGKHFPQIMDVLKQLV